MRALPPTFEGVTEFLRETIGGDVTVSVLCSLLAQYSVFACGRCRPRCRWWSFRASGSRLCCTALLAPILLVAAPLARRSIPNRWVLCRSCFCVTTILTSLLTFKQVVHTPLALKALARRFGSAVRFAELDQSALKDDAAGRAACFHDNLLTLLCGVARAVAEKLSKAFPTGELQRRVVVFVRFHTDWLGVRRSVEAVAACGADPNAVRAGAWYSCSLSDVRSAFNVVLTSSNCCRVAAAVGVWRRHVRQACSVSVQGLS